MSKNISLILILLILATTSCEDVVDVDLRTAEPRLVIDAYLKWQKGTPGNEQVIKLTTTTGYFNIEIPTVSDAIIYVSDQEGNIFDFIEDADSGEYFCSNFMPVIGYEYQLTVVLNGQMYVATEILKPAPVIDMIEQDNEGGIIGEDIEVKAYFTDNGATSDYYLMMFRPNFISTISYDVTEDKFYQGNQIFGLYSHPDMKSGDEVIISISGISERYYNYMNILLSVAGSNSGSPFQSPPATVRGNIINTTDPQNYALGYFSASETDVQTYIVQ